MLRLTRFYPGPDLPEVFVPQVAAAVVHELVADRAERVAALAETRSEEPDLLKRTVLVPDQPQTGAEADAVQDARSEGR